jgi:hypothetical protein
VTIQLHIANETNKGNEHVPSQANPGYDLNPHGNVMTRLETLQLDFDISFTFYFLGFAAESRDENVGLRKHSGNTRPHYKACLGKILDIKLSRTRLRHLRLKAVGQMSQRRPKCILFMGINPLETPHTHNLT